MPAIYTDAQKIRISFENNDITWKDAFPAIFQVQDTTATTWFANSTFLYEGNTTFRSGTINHRGTTTVILNFTLSSPGSITFNYSGQSESRYDWLTVLLDSSQIVRVAGTYAWTTFTQQLGVGPHTIQFSYTKDGSGSSGLDAFAIGYIELDGVIPQFDNWYLIKNNSNDKFYKEVDGALEEVTIEGTEPTLEEFREYGNEALPNTGLLTNISRYSILKCIDTPDWQDKGTLVNATIQGNMKPTLMKLNPPAVMVEEYQTGFNKIEASITHAVTTDVKFVISYDNTTWHAYNGSAWIEVDYTEEAVLLSGMTETVLNALTVTEFSLLYTGTEPLVMWIALVVKSTAADDWSINSLRISFTTNL